MKNEKREPTAVPNPIRDLFENAKFILGENHFNDGKMEPCGPNCPHREKTISCPYFKPTVPCLVGCTVQFTQGVQDEGLDYDQATIFVIAQAGTHLIGYENIVNIDSPRINRLRILTDKFGNEIAPPEAMKDVTLFEDMQEGVILGETHELKGTVGQENTEPSPLECPSCGSLSVLRDGVNLSTGKQLNVCSKCSKKWETTYKA